MDLTRLAVDTGQLINRAVQYTGETLGQAERTELDSGLEELLARAEATKTWTDQIVSQTEALLQPNPGARLEDRLYEHLDWSAPPRQRVHEVLGDHMIQAGLEMGPNTPYGTALLRSGDAQRQISEAERKFAESTKIHFFTPLRSFTEGEYRAIQDERRVLVNKRLDLDIAKTRLRRAHEADAEARNLNGNPLGDDYVAHFSYMFSFLRVKWLKMWAQEISQAEMELRICQSLFDRQSEITRRLLEGIGTTHTNHMRSLTDFVEAQTCYYAHCHQHAQELHKQLACIPAVLCSNKWQSAINNAVYQPSTSNHVANEPIGLNQVTPSPIVIHQLPGFQQAPLTANSLSGTEKETIESSVTTQPPDQTNNNNNNNNTSSADSQAASWSSAANGEISQSAATEHSSGTWLPATNQADNHLSAINPTDQLPVPNRLANQHLTTSGRAVEPPTSNETTSQSLTSCETVNQLLETNRPFLPSELNGIPSKPQTANNTASEPQTANNTASEPQTANSMASEPQTANSMASEPLTANNTASEPQTADSMASEPQTADSMASEPQTANSMVSEPQTADSMASQPQKADSMANEPQTANSMAREPLTASSMASEPLTANNTASEPQTDDSMTSEPQTTNSTANEPQTANSIASESLTTNSMASESLTTNNMASEPLTTNNTASEPLTTNETTAEPPNN